MNRPCIAREQAFICLKYRFIFNIYDRGLSFSAPAYIAGAESLILQFPQFHFKVTAAVTGEDNLALRVDEQEGGDGIDVIEFADGFGERLAGEVLPPGELLLLHGLLPLGFFLVHGDADELDLLAVLLVHLPQVGEAGAARSAPRCPEVDKGIALRVQLGSEGKGFAFRVGDFPVLQSLALHEGAGILEVLPELAERSAGVLHGGEQVFQFIQIRLVVGERRAFQAFRQKEIDVEVVVFLNKGADNCLQFLAVVEEGFVVCHVAPFLIGIFIKVDVVTVRDGLLLVTEEYVLCGRTFQGVILFLADVVCPERTGQTVDVGRLKRELAVLRKEGNFHVFDEVTALDAFTFGEAPLLMDKRQQVG